MIKKDEIKENDWLWCLHCERFFQAKDLKQDTVGGKQGCAFDDCDGAGYEVDIFPWDSWPSQNPHLKKHWPKSIEDLKKGSRAVLKHESSGQSGLFQWVGEMYAEETEVHEEAKLNAKFVRAVLKHESPGQS